MKLSKDTVEFKRLGVTPEVFCGSKEDYEKQPVRALFDLLMFFEADGRQKTHYAGGRVLPHIPAHLLAFVVGRLRLFADPKKPVGLEEAFGPETNRQRTQLLAEHRNVSILMDIMWNKKRLWDESEENLTPKQLKKKRELTQAEIVSLADKYGLSEEMVRKISRGLLPGPKW